MRVLEAALVTADGTRVSVARQATVDQGWGVTGLVALAAHPPSGWPTRLDLAWHALRDNRRHAALFDLPHVHLCRLAAAGLPRPAGLAPAACDTVLVGMAPGGRVALWLAGGGLARQVCLSISDEAGAEGPATQRWDRRNRRMRWQPMLTDAIDGATVRITAFNGDREHLDIPGPTPTEALGPVPERGLPHTMTLQWADPQAGPLVACIQFDEAELFAAADTLLGAQAGQALALHIEPSDPRAMRLYLCDSRHSLELMAAQITVYQDRGLPAPRRR